MDHSDVGTIAAWVTEQGLNGATEAELLAGFCEACRNAGMRLDRAMALMDTLHPVHEGRAFRWDSVEDFEGEFEYGPSGEGQGLDTWRRSAFYHLWTSGDREVRRRIGFGDPTDFIMLDQIYKLGHTDYVAMAHRFAEAGTIGEMDCFFSHFRRNIPKAFPTRILRSCANLCRCWDWQSNAWLLPVSPARSPRSISVRMRPAR